MHLDPDPSVWAHSHIRKQHSRNLCACWCRCSCVCVHLQHFHSTSSKNSKLECLLEARQENIQGKKKKKKKRTSRLESHHTYRLLFNLHLGSHIHRRQRCQLTLSRVCQSVWSAFGNRGTLLGDTGCHIVDVLSKTRSEGAGETTGGGRTDEVTAAYF